MRSPRSLYRCESAPTQELWRSFPYLVMTGNWLNFGKQASCFRLEHRHIIIRPGKGFHRIQRVKEVHGDKLGFKLTVIAQNVAAVVAFYGLESRVYHFPQQFFI